MNSRFLISRRTLWITGGGIAVLLVGALFLAGGCGRTTKVTEKHKAKNAAADQPALEVAAELLRKQPDLARCQEAVQLANAHLNAEPTARAEASEGGANPKLLRDTFHLTDEEIRYLTRSTFTDVDAYHLELCYRLRGVVTALRLRNLPPLEQARQGFGWAMRQIVLDHTEDEPLPPQLALKRGRGTPQERALLFLALMHQLKLPGCMVAIPDGKEGKKRYWAPGVLIGAEAGKGALPLPVLGASTVGLMGSPPGQGPFLAASALVPGRTGAIYLFDTRLSLPLPGPGGNGVATLDQVRCDPELLNGLTIGQQKYDVTPAQVARAEVCLVCPLAALSPRMRYLEQNLQKKDQIRLAESPEELQRQFEVVEGKGKVRVWNEPAREGQPPPQSPVRGLRPFLGPDQSGTGSPKMIELFEAGRIPGAVIYRQFLSMGVLTKVYAAAPQKRLLDMTRQMYTQYALQPQDDLTRGRWDQELTRPLVRIGRVLRAFHQAFAQRSKEEKEQMLDEWATKLIQANLAAVDKAPGAAVRYEKVWSDDQFMAQLLAAGAEDNELNPDLKKTTLTYILLEALEEPLLEESQYLLARCWQEKAFRAQHRIASLQADGKKVSETKKKEAALGWLGAEEWGKNFVQVHALAPAAIHQRLDDLSREVKNSRSDLVLREELWEDFFKNLHRAVALRLHQADGMALAGQQQEAVAQWQALKGDLESLLANAELKKSLKEFKEQLEASFGSGPNTPQHRLEQTAATLDAGGSLPWLLHAVTLRLERKKS